MYLPQIWSFRNCAEVRRVVRPAAEHCQRENLRVPLVLVRHPQHTDRNLAVVSRRRRDGTEITLVPAACPITPCTTGSDRDDRPQMSDRRLVHTVSARQEHRPADIQGGGGGPRQEARGQRDSLVFRSGALSCHSAPSGTNYHKSIVSVICGQRLCDQSRGGRRGHRCRLRNVQRNSQHALPLPAIFKFHSTLLFF